MSGQPLDRCHALALSHRRRLLELRRSLQTAELREHLASLSPATLRSVLEVVLADVVASEESEQ